MLINILFKINLKKEQRKEHIEIAEVAKKIDSGLPPHFERLVRFDARDMLDQLVPFQPNQSPV